MAGFRYFVILADMRTGSNFLEASLDGFAELTCYGELFNSGFIGKHNRDALFGIDLAARERDPLALIAEMMTRTEGIPGFRLFSNHDPRVIDHVLTDPDCAKIRLTRVAIDSYISWKIAQSTDQWRLSNHKKRRTTKIIFDAEDFVLFQHRRAEFGRHIDRTLQTGGQTAFRISYEELSDVQILNGLGRFLGAKSEISAPSQATKRQNPEPLSEKVINVDELQKTLNGSSQAEPEADPTRGPNTRSFLISGAKPLLFMPLPGSVGTELSDWLGDPITGQSQKKVRDWQKRNRPHLAFSVLRHPVERAFRVYRDYFCAPEQENLAEIATVMTRQYQIEFPSAGEEASQDRIKRGFLSYLDFLKPYLAGQTSLRIDPLCLPQSTLLRGIADFRPPDMVIHEANLRQGLDHITQRLGLPDEKPGRIPDTGVHLAEIYDMKIEKRTFSVYRKDYIAFGFEDWAEHGQGSRAS